MLNIVLTESKFSADQRTALAAIAAEMVTTTGSNPSHNERNQVLSTPLHYSTAKDWDVLDSTVSISTKLNVIADRCRLLGLCNPKEKTVRSLVAIVPATEQHIQFQPDILHTMVTDLKKLLHLKVSGVAGRLANYPPSPSSLPDVMFQAAYRDGVPVTKTIEGFAAIAAKIPLRGSNKALSSSSQSSHAVLQQGNAVDQLLLQLQLERQHGQQRLQPHHPTIALTPYGQDLARRASMPGHDQRSTWQHVQPLANVPHDSTWGSPVPPPPPPVQPPWQSTMQVPIPQPAQQSVQTPMQPPPQQMLPAPMQPALKDAVQAPGGDADDDDAIQKLEAVASKGVAIKRQAAARKRPAAADDAMSEAGRSTATAGKAKVAHKLCLKKLAVAPVVLGCAKCRGSVGGCGQCHERAFTGKRFCRSG